MAKKRTDPAEAVRGMIGEDPTESPHNADKAPTDADDSGEKPTREAESRQAPTNADNTELVRLTSRIAAWQKAELEAKARREGRLLSELVREAVRQYLRGGR